MENLKWMNQLLLDSGQIELQNQMENTEMSNIEILTKENDLELIEC